MSARQRNRVTRKSPAELETMRAGGRLCAQTLAAAAAAVKPGVTTGDLDKLAREMLQELGAEPSFLGYNGYPAALCVSVEDEVVHGIPQERVLVEGEIVGLDLGVHFEGFHTDSALTVPVGEVDELRQRLLEATQACLRAAINHAQVGHKLSEVSAAVQRCAEDAGFSVVRDLVGHGIGRAVHEPPQVPNFLAPGQFVDYDITLRPGMTLAIEPMINSGAPDVELQADGWTVRAADRQPSAHFEHTVALTRQGPQILTRA
jgi:methionyl aminopeptidase